MIGVGFFVATKTTVGTRLRARLTNTPYGDIAVSDRGQMMGSTTSVGTHNSQTSNPNVFAWNKNTKVCCQNCEKPQRHHAYHQ